MQRPQLCAEKVDWRFLQGLVLQLHIIGRLDKFFYLLENIFLKTIFHGYFVFILMPCAHHKRKRAQKTFLFLNFKIPSWQLYLHFEYAIIAIIFWM